MKKLPRSVAGVALVIVLALLSLMVVIVVALLSSASTQNASASNYRASVEIKQLASAATGVVIGQILDATRSFKGVDAASGRLAWASQPGMIRTWDDDGKGWKVFKLYSSREMVANFDGNGRYSVAAQLPNEVPNTWPQERALFTDLNAPVLVEDSAGPIVRDGRKLRASYPIMDPLASIPTTGTNPIPGVSGFALGVAPGVNSVGLAPALDPTEFKEGKSSNPAAMPVRWIYVLKDGTFTVPTGSTDEGLTATWTGADVRVTPSKENPIVGRVAFWTDDESCKLNVNTASEPTAWDSPRSVNIKDLNYGKFQPAQHEFQRFPGHPSTVALSPVFFPGTQLTPAQREEIYKLLPRVQPGGSTSATVAAKTAATITLDTDRLYANVDEFLFRPEMPGTARVDNALVNAERLRQSRFFLTANSRAPELNLFGQPRITLWPVSADPAQRTVFDQLAAFCGTIGTGAQAKPFYFQRIDATSPTADYANLKRNQELYSYMQRLTDGKVPGYGGSFNDKWGADRDQVLTEIFDYVRSTNLRDPIRKQLAQPVYAERGQVAPIKIGSTQGFGRFHSISQFGIHFICSQDGPNGQSDPVTAGNPNPLNPPLAVGKRAIEAALIFEPFSPSLGYHELQEAISYEVKFITPMRVDGDDLNFPTGPQTVKSGGLTSGSVFGDIWHGRSWGGAQGIRGLIARFGGGNYPLRGPISSKTRAKVTANAQKNTMSFSGGDVEVKVYSGITPAAGKLIQTFTVNFPSTTLPIPELVQSGTTAIRGGNATSANQWWTLSSRYGNANQCPHAPGAEYSDAKRRWGKDNTNNDPGFKIGGVFRAEDVVRTLVPETGDIRLVAASSIAGTSAPLAAKFVPGAGYNDSGRKLDHIFSEPQGPHMLYGFGNEPGLTSPLGTPTNFSQLVPIQYHYARLAEITPGAGLRFNKWNDFDNGFGHMTDGAYIGKPDEGNIADQNSQYPYFSWDYAVPSEKLFSPSRLVPSAAMLGSLPTGVKRGLPWQTLLFRPEVRTDLAGRPHPGTTSPKDHLLMDLFWMPVIEPYAISEPFSTAGKVNLNYEIAPFSYIRRATALHGVMKSEEPLVMPHDLGTVPLSKTYKLWDHETNDWPYFPNSSGRTQDIALGAEWDKVFKGQAPYDKLRRPIDVTKTLAQADQRFATGEAFRSATEVCELHLVREGETLKEYEDGTIWKNAQITGENTRERPYANLLARLTTRSNTFTVHMRVQALRQPGSKEEDFKVWREGRSEPAGEYRGSTLIERYIDPADPTLPDFATTPDRVADTAYRMRVLLMRKFVP